MLDLNDRYDGYNNTQFSYGARALDITVCGDKQGIRAQYVPQFISDLLTECGLTKDDIPDPAPATERVQWYEAQGRTTPSGQEITYVRKSRNSGVTVLSFGEPLSVASDGTVEVLVQR